MNLLFSSAGRRVGLIGCFRQALEELRLPGRLVAVDAAPHAPALLAADAAYLVPRCDEPDFVDRLHEICEAESVDAVIPTIDTELPVLAAATTASLRRVSPCGPRNLVRSGSPATSA